MSSAARVRPFRALARCLFLTLAVACGEDGAELVAPPDPDRIPSSPLGDAALQTIRDVAHPITGAGRDYDALVAAVGEARVVVLGEATHGSEEFYRERARITQRLILEKGFAVIAVEGGSPETDRVNDWIAGRTSASAEEALAGFTDFPAWMWRNGQVRDLAVWLRAHNASRPAAQGVGIYGLDISSVAQASDRVVEYAASVDPALADRVRAHYACFAPYRSAPQRYGAAAAAGEVDCRQAAVDVLAAITGLGAAPASDVPARSARFSAMRNAQAVVNAEEFYRSLPAPGAGPWDVRDQRMSEMLVTLEQHLSELSGLPPKVVVWAHTSHAGDARTPDAESAGESGLAQLTRARLGDAVFRVGLLTYIGTVRAADAWGAPAREVRLLPAIPQSFSDAFHRVGIPDFMLIMDGPGALRVELQRRRLERAVGAVYTPMSEQQNHYFVAHIARDLDAVIFVDRTRAVAELP